MGIVVLERFDAARDTASAVRTAAGDGAAQEAGPSLTVAWLVATAVAVVVAIFVAIGLVRAAARKGAAEATRAAVVTGTTILLWAVWSASGALTDDGLGFRTPRTLLLLAVVYIVFFVVPLTADQTAEVLRAWGDDSWPRVLIGTAGALLLGVASRGSSRRLLALSTPAETSSGDNPWVPWCAVGAGLVGIVAWIVKAHAAAIGLWLGAAAVLGSRPSGRTPVASEQLDDTSKRFADTVGLVPLLILTAGLVDATVDSWLISGSSARLRLTLITLGAVGLLRGPRRSGSRSRQARQG